MNWARLPMNDKLDAGLSLCKLTANERIKSNGDHAIPRVVLLEAYARRCCHVTTSPLDPASAGI